MLAGERALAAYAWEEAQAHYERALAAKEAPSTGSEAAKDPVEAALLFGLGRAQAATAERHQREDTVTTMRRAFDYYAEAAQVELAVAVAEYPMYATSHNTGRTQLLSRALELVPPIPMRRGVFCRATAWSWDAREVITRVPKGPSIGPCSSLSAREMR